MKFASKLIHGGPVHLRYEPVEALQQCMVLSAGQMVLSAWINNDPSSTGRVVLGKTFFDLVTLTFDL